MPDRHLRKIMYCKLFTTGLKYPLSILRWTFSLNVQLALLRKCYTQARNIYLLSIIGSSYDRKMKFRPSTILELQKYVDNLIVIPNQNIFWWKFLFSPCSFSSPAAPLFLPLFPFNKTSIYLHTSKKNVTHPNVQLQNQEMISEGDLACAMDQSNKIREMQDKISNLRAQVPIFIEFIYNLCISPARPE